MLRSKQPPEVVDRVPPLEALLATWRVLPDPLRELRAVHARALNHAVGSRCLALAERGACGVVAPVDLPARALDATWTTPELAFAYYVALRAPDVSGATVQAAVESLLHVSASLPPPVDFRGGRNQSEWKRHGLRTLVEDHQRDGRTSEVRPARPAAADVDACVASHGILGDSWPEMASAIDLLVRDVVWFGRSTGASSGTLIQTFGAVFLARGQALPHVLTALVHETTHIEVIARLAVDDALLNARDLDVSPFRRRPRPLSRVLHAALVAVRCVEALDRSIDALPPSDRDAAVVLRRTFAASLGTAAESLRRSGRWTSLGARMFEEVLARRAQVERA